MWEHSITVEHDSGKHVENLIMVIVWNRAIVLKKDKTKNKPLTWENVVSHFVNRQNPRSEAYFLDIIFFEDSV